MQSLNIVQAGVFGFIGLLVGSFLNVVIYRLPKMMEKQWATEVAEFKGETLPDEAVFNLMLPRSKCPKCAHQIRWYENIPLLSYLFLRGKCSACNTPISLRYPTIELITGALFFYCILHWGLTPTGLAWC
jgi:leader peptidase (prepilin peptidase)/N-methyltransferase